MSGLAITIAAGCGAAPAARSIADRPSARLAAGGAGESRVRSLRALFSSVTRLPGGGTRSADGVLLVAKPDRFRLRLMLPFGFTVFDYVNVGEQTWMALPLADAAHRDRIGEFAPFSREDLGQAFLRGGTRSRTMRHRVGRGRRSDGDLPRGWPMRRTLRIGGDGIVEETSYAAGAPRMVIRYADYRAVGGIALPFRISLEYPQRQQSVDITIDRYEVNPTLSDDLFRPPPDSAEQRASCQIPSWRAGDGEYASS
jgi:hypothetical protein